MGEWRNGKRDAPFKMISGAAVVDGKVAYFMSCVDQVFSYDSSTQRMSKLPQCPHWSSSLVIIF